MLRKERLAEFELHPAGYFDAHDARVDEMASTISVMRKAGFPGEEIAKIIAHAPMRLYGEARDQIFPKEK